MDRLTTKRGWREYWLRKDLIKKVGKHYWFSDVFEKELKGKKYKSSIEIGGYPGYFSIYFRKFWNYDATLLDFVNNFSQIKKLLQFNDLKPNGINIISTDFLSFKTKKNMMLFYPAVLLSTSPI